MWPDAALTVTPFEPTTAPTVPASGTSVRASDKDQPASPTLFDGADAGAPAPAARTFVNQDDAPSCPDCGAIMIRSGSCYKCLNCGSTSGCS